MAAGARERTLAQVVQRRHADPAVLGRPPGRRLVRRLPADVGRLPRAGVAVAALARDALGAEGPQRHGRETVGLRRGERGVRVAGQAAFVLERRSGAVGRSQGGLDPGRQAVTPAGEPVVGREHAVRGPVRVRGPPVGQRAAPAVGVGRVRERGAVRAAVAGRGGEPDMPTGRAGDAPAGGGGLTASAPRPFARQAPAARARAATITAVRASMGRLRPVGNNGFSPMISAGDASGKGIVGKSAANGGAARAGRPPARRSAQPHFQDPPPQPDDQPVGDRHGRLQVGRPWCGPGRS